ncbi:MAG: HNH endonuclease [Muribaculaceae bacterium]|nr:HNH endonuclease [Muribaculaceae bacterium]
MICIGANLPTSKYIDDEDYWMDKSIYKDVIANFKRFAEFKLVERLPNTPQLSFEVLKKHGLKTVQSSHRMNSELLNYIESVLQSRNGNNDCEVDYPNDETAFYEGAVMKVLVNKYERNAKARQECIAKLGCKCAVCGCDFAKRYGKLGEGFIHVHHIVPIGNIGKEYVLNPVKDLVPVCPNCHYMLHRTNPPIQPEELMKLIH